MVKPILLQDNFSKTLIAQRMADEAHAGAEKQQALHDQAALAKQEERTRQRTAATDERPGTKGIDAEAGGRRHTTLKKQPKSAEDEEGSEEAAGDVESDLRKRREEDDLGKGSEIDLLG